MKTVTEIIEYLEKGLQEAEKQFVVANGSEYVEGVVDAYKEILSYIWSKERCGD